MAASEERAARIRTLKDSRPDLTWDRIAEYVDVKERSAIEWVRSGGITHDNCVLLAELFDVDSEWLWSGREVQEGAADLMASLGGNSPSQLDRIEAKVDAIEAKLDALLAVLPTPQRTPEEIAAEAARQRNDKSSTSPAGEKRKTKTPRAA